ncbi:hypothetical protein ACLOAV_010153 [Pseudogymnoascus australis]
MSKSRPHIGSPSNTALDTLSIISPLVSLMLVVARHAVSTTTVNNDISTPTSIYSGMVSNCNAFYEVKSGDECGIIASIYGIAIAQLYTWNPARLVLLAPSNLWLDNYKCVSIIGTSPGPSPITMEAATWPRLRRSRQASAVSRAVTHA